MRGCPAMDLYCNPSYNLLILIVFSSQREGGGIMKTLITYYSFSGNTDKVVKIFSDVLRKRGEVSVQRLEPKDKITSFIAQCRAAFMRKRAELSGSVIYDAGPYDLVLFGSPVWAFAPTPAMNTYLDNVSGLKGKRAVILLTSGSGAGVKKCFNNIRSVLEAKGVISVSEINIPDRRQGDENFMISLLEKML
jgi:flavodoxin